MRPRLSSCFWFAGFGWVGLILFFGCATSHRGWNSTEPLDSVAWELGAKQNLGQSLSGVWSSLTSAEVTTLGRMDAAQSGESQALLRLYILASGRNREEKDIERYQSQVAHFCDSMVPVLNGLKTETAKAEALFKGMYRHFIKSGRGGPTFGYDFGHSDLTRLLDERIYNCISITMLYIVICRHFQIKAQPVLIPGHAFVQLQLSSNNVIEVEAVTRDGFNIKHDQAFYSAQGSLFGSIYGRNITFADYKKRRILQPWEIAVENMSNQHTMPSVLGMQGYFRLRELQSVIQPTKLEYRRERLSLYLQAAQKSKEDSNFSETLRLCQVTHGFLDSVHATMEQDSGIRRWYAHLRLLQAEASLHQSEEDTSFFTNIDAALEALSKGNADSSLFHSNSYALLMTRWVGQVSKQRFQVVEREMNRYAHLCRKESYCGENRAWLFSSWAMDYWDKKEWEPSIQKFGLAYLYATESRPTIAKNMGVGYCNWSNDLAVKQDFKGCARILNTCLQKSPNPKPCRERIVELKKAGFL